MSPVSTPLQPHEPSENLGFVRINWRSIGGPRKPTLLLVPPECDAGSDFVSALGELGYKTDNWGLDDASIRSARRRRDEFQRMRGCFEASGSSDWVGVLPFHRGVVPLVEKTFADASIVLLCDDLVGLGMVLEGYTTSIQRSILAAAKNIVDMAVFFSSTSQPAMLISMRKAKEYPETIIHALNEFSGANVHHERLGSASLMVGRPQALVAVAPIKKLVVSQAIRGGIEPVHKHGAITGWAKRALTTDPVEVSARVNGKEIARATADVVRQDLLLSGVGDGRHGFILDVQKSLSSGAIRIEVVAVDTGLVIGAVDMNVERGERVPINSQSAAPSLV